MPQGEIMPEKALPGLGIIAILALLVGGGYVFYKITREAFGAEEREEARKEYQLELEQLIDYQGAIAGAGREPTEEESQIMSIMQEWLIIKEEHAQSEGWFPIFVETAEDVASRIGLWIVLPAVAGWVAILLFKELWRRRPPRPPQFICQACSKVLDSLQALKNHRKTEHRITLDPADIATAQSYFQQVPTWTQYYVGAASGAYGRVGQDWRFLPEEILASIADALNESFAYYATTWLSLPIISRACALLLIPIL